MNFEQDLDEVLKKIKDTLIEKNKKYGDAALNPKKIFSKLTPLQSILARCDEKISRAMEDNDNEDEDIKKDLMGWLILAEIAEKRERVRPSIEPFLTPLDVTPPNDTGRHWYVPNPNKATCENNPNRLTIDELTK